MKSVSIGFTCFSLLAALTISGCWSDSSTYDGHMADPDDTSELYERVYAWLETQYRNNVDLASIPAPHQTFLCAFWSDGYISNGGFKYLLEATFNGDPHYELIRKSFERIGAVEATKAFRIAFSAFPDGKPPLETEKRLSVWENARDNGVVLDGEVVDVGYDANELYWDSPVPVIKLLERFVESNATAFPVRIR
jgi:hypothetical protein